MEIKLSSDEVAQLAAEVVRLMKQEGLMMTSSPASSEHASSPSQSLPTDADFDPDEIGIAREPATLEPVTLEPTAPESGTAIEDTPFIPPSGKKGKNKATAGQKASRKPPKVASADSAGSTSSSSGPYSIDTAAEIKGYHPNTIRRAIKSGKLKGKLGPDGKYRIKPADLNAFSI